MKRYNSTLIKMTRRLGMAIAALLMLSTMASCSDQDSQAPATGDEAYLNLSFSTASTTTSRASRAENIGKDDETQANPNAESDIHSIKVWVFKSGTGASANPIAYKEDTPTAVDGSTVNSQYTLNLRFLRKINGEELKNIDLYILANSESTNMADKLGKDFRNITRADLQGVTFDDPFGITADGKAQTTEVPTGKGLPISRAITNIEIAKHVADTEIEAKDKGISIPLVRAVSKLHFYFARTADADALTENVKVTKIEIDGNTFPTESYVFPDEEPYATADANKSATSNKYGTPTYVDTKLTLDGVENTGIKAVTNPETYKRGPSETAQAYMNRMKEIGEHNLCYLRETNKPITGKIYYQLADGGFERSQEFTIPSSGNAIRNRELVVYGYFLQGGALCLDWQVMPWNKVTSEISWSNVNCQMFAWHKSSPSATTGDEEGKFCLVNYPRYATDKHNSLVAKSSGAAFYFKVDGPTGLVWKAHLTNPTEFAFNYAKSTESTNCVSTGIARTAPYQIKVEALKPWTEGTSFDQLTDWAKGKGSNPVVYTDLYVTVSLDGIHEYEVEINPDGAGGMYKKGRKFAGTNTRIRIFQLKAIKDKGYDELQKESGHYTNYLK
nr:hypothetical protein [uncultured Prevotella sp.]